MFCFKKINKELMEVQLTVKASFPTTASYLKASEREKTIERVGHKT